MNSQQLEYFCKVVEHGSLSRAAFALSMNQSALSRHMRNLEEELGIPLLYRNGRGVTLTANGQRLLERAKRALGEMDLARQDAANARTSGLESVTVGMTPTIRRLLLKPLAEQLIRRHPNVKLRFAEGISGDLAEWLERGRIDMAIMYQVTGVATIRLERLITERLALVSAASAPPLPATTAIADLPRFPLILPNSPLGLRRLVNTAAANQRVDLRIEIEADSFDAMLCLVKAGMGSTLLPASSVEAEVQRGEVQTSTLVDEPIIWPIGLATPNNRPLVPGLSGVVSVIRKELRKYDMSRAETH